MSKSVKRRASQKKASKKQRLEAPSVSSGNLLSSDAGSGTPVPHDAPVPAEPALAEPASRSQSRSSMCATVEDVDDEDDEIVIIEPAAEDPEAELGEKISRYIEDTCLP